MVFILRYSYHRADHFPEAGDDPQKREYDREPTDRTVLLETGMEQMVQSQTDPETDHRRHHQGQADGADLQPGAQPARALRLPPGVVVRAHPASWNFWW